MEHKYNLLLLGAEGRACGLLVEMLLLSTTHTVFTSSYTPLPSVFFFLLLVADNSAPVAVFFPFDGGYSSYVSTCFESSCQLTLVYTYESHFATPI